MNQTDIITRFFEKGNLLSPEAVGFLAGTDAGQFFNKNYPDLVLLPQHFSEIRVLKNVPPPPKEVSAGDHLKFYTRKYQRMRAIIESRIQKDFVSLNKLDAYRSEVFILGIVKDLQKKERYVIELEDPSGAVTVIADDAHGVELDDVIVVHGVAAGKTVYGKKILFPDIPLRQPARAFGKACFISDPIPAEAPPAEVEALFSWAGAQKPDYIFFTGAIDDTEQFNRLVAEHCRSAQAIASVGPYPSPARDLAGAVTVSNPGMVEVNGIKVLLSSTFAPEMLKKRHLPGGTAVYHDDYFALDDVPDIVHAAAPAPHTSNYKSTSIVSSGSLLTECRPVIIDLATRDIVQAKITGELSL